ncbi:Uncharacterised protein [Salmonella enterica subsp. enterica serovar Bovismorbificans]|nr:Uncharacterised protein [Salmonella enterica subsp. enterica serovar Bovismorbificans]CPR83281.1 Uncharacterised protein [Salmonella enterica subsp. enterica serovar Bovismorbificans]CQQ75619.1 Uncharacterised protein [Salmonella enterica subsp. enterica serovar Typhimurium str. DT104]
MIVRPTGFISSARPSQINVWPTSRSPFIRPFPSSIVRLFAPLPNDFRTDSARLPPPSARPALTFRKISIRRINGDAMRFAPSLRIFSAPLNSQITLTTLATPCTSAGFSRSQALNCRTSGVMLCASSPMAGISSRPTVSHRSLSESCNALVCSPGDVIFAAKSSSITCCPAACIAEAFSWRYSSIFASIGARKSRVCASPNIAPRLNFSTMACSASPRAERSSIFMVCLKVSRICGFIFSSCICTMWVIASVTPIPFC